jgi:outer membrane lipoprotein carrier protein
MYKNFLFAALILAMSNMVLAQQDPKAKEILDAMSNKYKRISSFQADLSYTMTNKVEDINESYKGKIAVKGDMYRLVMQDQEIYNDGTTIWTYLPSLDEPEVTIDTNNPDGGDITPSSIFNIYQEGYKYLYLNSSTIDGKSYDIVDLVPNDKDAQYFKVRIEIGTKDRLLRTFTLFDREGSEYTYLITNFKSDVNLSDAYFRFDTSKLTEDQIIDIR